MPHRIRRIGLLPGSFDPPHLGHVDLALQSRHSAGLDGCFFYINSINAAKQADLIPWQQRHSCSPWCSEGKAGSFSGLTTLQMIVEAPGSRKRPFFFRWSKN
jgi:nicotinic acid mononucleotide adenylyltransferase